MSRSGRSARWGQARSRGQRLQAELPTAAINPKSTKLRLKRGLVAVAVDPLDYATRAHEILEDAQRDLMSGLDVPWSGAGVLATAAGVAATKELMSTLAPIMTSRGNAYGTSEYWLSTRPRAGQRRRRDGTCPTLHELTPGQLQLIDGTPRRHAERAGASPASLETRTSRTPEIPTESRGAEMSPLDRRRFCTRSLATFGAGGAGAAVASAVGRRRTPRPPTDLATQSVRVDHESSGAPPVRRHLSGGILPPADAVDGAGT